MFICGDDGVELKDISNGGSEGKKPELDTCGVPNFGDDTGNGGNSCIPPRAIIDGGGISCDALRWV